MTPDFAVFNSIYKNLLTNDLKVMMKKSMIFDMQNLKLPFLK